MVTIDLTSLMEELLNKDRFRYMEIIMNSEDGAGSLEIAREILRSRGVTRHKDVLKENIKVNKRLRKLVDLGILISYEKGKYSVSSLGYLLMDSWRELNEKTDTVVSFGEFFDFHNVNDIPLEFFRQIYRLRKAKLTENPVQWESEVREYMKKIERKFYNLTEYLHDFPEEIMEKKEIGEIEEIAIIYEFFDYPKLNYLDEKKEHFDRLVKAGAEFRYLILEDKYPIGIRIVDEKWATFGLARIPDGELDRGHSFIGTDPEFISWCRELFYHVWHFKAKPLDVRRVLSKREE